MLDGGTVVVEYPDAGCLTVTTAIHFVVKLDHDMIALTRPLFCRENLLSKPFRDRRTKISNRTRCTVDPSGKLFFIHLACLHPASPNQFVR